MPFHPHFMQTFTLTLANQLQSNLLLTISLGNCDSLCAPPFSCINTFCLCSVCILYDREWVNASFWWSTNVRSTMFCRFSPSTSFFGLVKINVCCGAKRSHQTAVAAAAVQMTLVVYKMAYKRKPFFVLYSPSTFVSNAAQTTAKMTEILCLQ